MSMEDFMAVFYCLTPNEIEWIRRCSIAGSFEFETGIRWDDFRGLGYMESMDDYKKFRQELLARKKYLGLD